SIDAIGDTAICLGNEATISATGTPSVIWDNGDTSKTRTINPSQTTYSYVTGTDEFGCTDSDSVLVTILETPLLTPMADTGGCFGLNTTLTAGGEADNYAWSNGDTTKSTTIRVTKNITMYVLASNDSGCEDSDTVEVARYIKPNGFTDNDTTICEGTSVSIQAYGGASYEWSNAETTETITVSPIEQTKYDVIIRSAEGCEDYDDITVSISPLPIPDFSFSKVEGKVTFTNLSSFSDSYSWDFGDSKSATDENPINEYDSTGTYTVRLTASNQCGSVDSARDVTVFVPKEVNNINAITKWNNVELYPVPSHGPINYTINNQLYGNMLISVQSITGEVLYEENTIKSKDDVTGTIDISSYSNGVYFIQFSIEGSSNRTRIIKH
ncbi:PKD domain-containing protein, partial [Bacteroidia bacterium]|nr:PKD domain-containing protein [Bacteroidia bacterium]